VLYSSVGKGNIEWTFFACSSSKDDFNNLIKFRDLTAKTCRNEDKKEKRKKVQPNSPERKGTTT